jgi:hypothetical protein
MMRKDLDYRGVIIRWLSKRHRIAVDADVLQGIRHRLSRPSHERRFFAALATPCDQYEQRQKYARHEY